MSDYRKELIGWLGKISAEGRTLDIGGKKWSVVSSLKSFKGGYFTLQKDDYDLNLPLSASSYETYDNIFCCEVMQYVFNPLDVLRNLNEFLAPEGKLYLSFYRDFPEFSPKDSDYLRYTKQGVYKLVGEAGLKVLDFQEPIKGFYLLKCEKSL